MKFFSERTKNDSPLVRILRFLALLSIFIIVGTLFWKNNQNSMRDIQGKMAIWDQTKTLNEAQKKSLHQIYHELHKRFGIKLKVSVTRDELIPPKMDTKTLFIGLCPGTQEAVVIFPPLVLGALGKELRDELQNEHFRNSWPNNGWVKKLGQAVQIISEKLMEIENEATS